MDQVNQAMGRFGGAPGAPSPADGPPPPGEQARRVFSEVSASGQGDPFSSAKEAWKAAVQAISDRLHAPNYQPGNPGESNLKKVVDFLEQSKGLDPLAATGLAMEMLGSMAEGSGAGSPGAPAPGGGGLAAAAPPPGSPPGPMMPTPMGG